MPIRIQVLYGSGVIQLWFSVEPFMKEFMLNTEWSRMLLAFIRDSNKYILTHTSNSVEEYTRIESLNIS
jgi:hypothetical protein